MSKILNKEICQGANIHLIKADKFKTCLLSLYINIPYNKENSSYASLLPMVLRRGSKNYPTLSSVAKHCEELYGASFYSGIRKKGDGAVLYFSLEFVSDEYIVEKIKEDAVSCFFSLS